MSEPIYQKISCCPFCGKNPAHGLTKVQYCQLHGDPFQDFQIYCPDGHCKIVAGDRERCTEIWNTRYPKEKKEPKP